MSVIEESLHSRLAGVSALTALVGTRIYPLHLPQNPTLPAITYQRVGADREHLLSSDTTMTHARLQYDIWGESYSSVRGVATQLRLALQRWNGTVLSVVTVDSNIDNELDFYEDDTGLFRVSMDFIVSHRE